jgi:hypothetical protein
MLHDASGDERKHKNCAKDYPRAEDHLLPVHVYNRLHLYHENVLEGTSYALQLLDTRFLQEVIIPAPRTRAAKQDNFWTVGHAEFSWRLHSSSASTVHLAV